MAQQFMSNSYDQSSYSSIQTHYKHQMQCSQSVPMPAGPVHIYPYISTSEPTNHSLTNIVEPMVSSNTVSPTFKSDDMPTLTPYPGQFNFRIFIPNGEYDDAKRKGQTCVFQTDELGNHHLFTKPQPHYWRLNYSANVNMPTENMFIRMVPVYGDPEKAQCILERCPKHKEILTDDNVLKNRSMLIIEKTSAHYFQDTISKRVCVMVPFDKHAEGQLHSSVNCQFACYNSCFNQDSGGRKTLYLIVTLETLDTKSSKFEVIGRQCLQFRSCACPSRDWRDKRIKSDSDSIPRIKDKRIKFEDKLTMFKSTPINMGGKDAIIRVLPSLPGIDEAINALVSGHLFIRASSNGETMDTVNDVIRQLKNVENCIIEQFTSSYDPNRCDVKSRSLSPTDSQISPLHTTTPYSQYSNIYSENYNDYMVRSAPLQQHFMPTYTSQNNYNTHDYNNGYSDIKSQLTVADQSNNFNDDLVSDRNFRH